MTQPYDLDDIYNTLFNKACNDLHKSEQFRLLCEKYDKALNILDAKFTESEKAFWSEYLGVLSELRSAESAFIYRKGLKDSIKILKKLSVFK